MFDRIVSKLTSIVRNTVRAIGAATHRMPWLVPTTILAVFFVL